MAYTNIALASKGSVATSTANTDASNATLAIDGSFTSGNGYHWYAGVTNPRLMITLPSLSTVSYVILGTSDNWGHAYSSFNLYYTTDENLTVNDSTSSFTLIKTFTYGTTIAETGIRFNLPQEITATKIVLEPIAYGPATTEIEIYGEPIKFLLKQNDLFYTINSSNYNSTLKQYTPLAGVDFTNGFVLSSLFVDNTIEGETFKPITKFSNFRIITNAESADLVFKGLKSNKELIIANDDIALSVANNIDYFKITNTYLLNGAVKIALSDDKGISWKTHDGTSFVNLSCHIPLKNYNELTAEELILWNEAKEEIATSGMIKTIFDAIDFNLITTGTIRFAYVITRPLYSDTAEVSQLEWGFDAKGSFQAMTYGEHVVNVYEEKIKVKSLVDSSIVKINVMA